MGEVIAFPGDRARRDPPPTPPRQVTAWTGGKTHAHVDGYRALCGVSVDPRTGGRLAFDPAAEQSCKNCVACLRRRRDA